MTTSSWPYSGTAGAARSAVKRRTSDSVSGTSFT